MKRPQILLSLRPTLKTTYTASTVSSSPYSTSISTLQTTTPTTPCSSRIDIHHSDIDREATAAHTTTPQLTPAADVELPKNDGRDLNGVPSWHSENKLHAIKDHQEHRGARMGFELEGLVQPLAVPVTVSTPPPPPLAAQGAEGDDDLDFRFITASRSERKLLRG
ncbi:hypothetical protein M407DRAFT_34467 [Tulasnella calospora MUT 4182]|uniref:Uncharacterized protein n=1 Tax=Tulasnella calospora MUT 4182 TaxID=1051891 RepID=A0A0C3Q0M1_9AGAM|nr:hypothetical protein M407DRAFT_34467 [Tulasnella calospora MUT 4182]